MWGNIDIPSMAVLSIDYDDKEKNILRGTLNDEQRKEYNDIQTEYKTLRYLSKIGLNKDGTRRNGLV